MAMYNETGVITWKSEVTTGTSQKGEWKRMTIVLHCDNKPQGYEDIALSVFGADKVDTINSVGGARVKVTFSINAKEYNGKRFNDVSLFKIEKDEPVPAPSPAPAPQSFNNIPPQELEPKVDDLPFD